MKVYNTIQITAMVLMITASIRQGEIMHFFAFNYILFSAIQIIQLKKRIFNLETINHE